MPPEWAVKVFQAPIIVLDQPSATPDIHQNTHLTHHDCTPRRPQCNQGTALSLSSLPITLVRMVTVSMPRALHGPSLTQKTEHVSVCLLAMLCRSPTPVTSMGVPLSPHVRTACMLATLTLAPRPSDVPLSRCVSVPMRVYPDARREDTHGIMAPSDAAEPAWPCCMHA